MIWLAASIILLVCVICAFAFGFGRKRRKLLYEMTATDEQLETVLTWSGWVSRNGSVSVLDAIGRALDDASLVFLSVELPADVLGPFFTDRRCLPLRAVRSEFADIWEKSGAFGVRLIAYGSPSATEPCSEVLDQIESGCSFCGEHDDLEFIRRYVAACTEPCVVLVVQDDGDYVMCCCSASYATLFNEVAAGLDSVRIEG